jgi:ketosteroid isomerase-like protein
MKIFLRSIQQSIMFVAALTSFMVSSAPNTSCHTTQAATTIMEQRDLFNTAISNADLKPIAAILSDSATLVTGSNSDLFNGKQAQLDIWESDFKRGDERDIYLRTTDCVSISDLGSMAIEYGQWKGFRDETTLYSGIYSAKWRFDDASQSWLLEAEIFMTNYIKSH